MFCPATAIHNFKGVKITQICVVWYRTFAKLDAFKRIKETIGVFSGLRVNPGFPMIVQYHESLDHMLISINSLICINY